MIPEVGKLYCFVTARQKFNKQVYMYLGPTLNDCYQVLNHEGKVLTFNKALYLVWSSKIVPAHTLHDKI